MHIIVGYEYDTNKHMHIITKLNGLSATGMIWIMLGTLRGIGYCRIRCNTTKGWTFMEIVDVVVTNDC